MKASWQATSIIPSHQTVHRKPTGYTSFAFLFQHFFSTIFFWVCGGGSVTHIIVDHQRRLCVFAQDWRASDPSTWIVPDFEQEKRLESYDYQVEITNLMPEFLSRVRYLYVRGDRRR